MAYGIQFDFDAAGDPPNVYIADDDGDGTVYMEIFEEPEWIGGDKRVFYSRRYESGPRHELGDGIWVGQSKVTIEAAPVDTESPWSNDGDDWRAGPLAMDVLAWLNSR